MRRCRTLAVLLPLLVSACGNDRDNPFSRPTLTRAPSTDAVLLYLSGAWASAAGAPRELFAINLDGSRPERLTTCAEAQTPCDFLGVAPSPDRTRVAAVRSTATAEQGASALYFMDLARSVETIVAPSRRISWVDWSPNGSLLLYTSVVATAGAEDLFTAAPDGTGEQNVTATTDLRERSPRFDSSSTSAVYERIDGTGVGRIYLFRATPLTQGPATGPALPGTPYVLGADADPAFSPDSANVVFRRLTGTGSDGLGTWDILRVRATASDLQQVATGPVFRGAPDWGTRGIVFVETDAAKGESRLVVVQPDGSGRTVLRTEGAGFGMAAPRWLRGS
jgi:Tol biopolymer transport system component